MLNRSQSNENRARSAIDPPAKRPSWRKKRWLLPAAFVAASGGLYQHNATSLPPNGLAFDGAPREIAEIEFFSDVSYLDGHGVRRTEQQIFDEILVMIKEAKSFLLIDMFLFNGWQGPKPETTRALSLEMTNALLAKKSNCGWCRIILITDPINTIYDGIASELFEALRVAGIEIVQTELNSLNDSNPVYSFFWRLLIRPWGNAVADTLPNPLGPGRVSLRSYLAMINFKANHRKVIVADRDSSDTSATAIKSEALSPDNLVALITSANPHDGSSAHRNTAIRFSGDAAADVVLAENAVLSLSGRPIVSVVAPDTMARQHSPSTQSEVELAAIQILTERRIKDHAISILQRAERGDRVDLLMFYLSDRDIIRSLVDAQRRGAKVRVLLDVNRDAFGRQKNGVPNKPVAHELVNGGVSVRWCETRGEQCHAKMLLVEAGNQHSLMQGSANFTRRNLDNYNLESDVLITGSADLQVIAAARAHFELMWSNEDNEIYSVPYLEHADESLGKKWLYRVMEATGLSTF